MCEPGATAITSEKEQNSYELLFTTQLSPADIIAGKVKVGGDAQYEALVDDDAV